MNVDIAESYANSKKRLFLLDYDGVLAEIVRLPWEAKPSREVLKILSKLQSDYKNTVVIISGRKHEDLDEWLGDIGLSFAAEHGMLYKEPGEDWIPVEGLNTDWKKIIRNLMQSYVNRFEGSFIEEKTNGLVWHYRTASDQDSAEKAAQELADNLEILAPTYFLRVMQGTKIVETQPLGVSKGVGARRWLDRKGWDFILVAGDDTTDEDMFKAAPETAITIKVGSGTTAARHRIATPKDMRNLLASFI